MRSGSPAFLRVRKGDRFTLVEMMIVVAIMMVLASIALPEVYESQLKARKSEAAINVQSIADASVGYHASMDTYPSGVSTDWSPGKNTAPCSTCGKTTRKWVPDEDGSNPTGFGQMGWQPDGDVRCDYNFFYAGGFATSRAKCDVDDDNTIYNYSAVVDGVTNVRTITPTCPGGNLDNCY